MRRLSLEQFGLARDFLSTEARPLEWALFEYRFEGAAGERVIAELASYQNADGGFGRALEPDVRTPSSSALATGIALARLAEVQSSPHHQMEVDAVRYLRSTFIEETQVWRVIPTDANDYPHAPWWHDEDGSLARTFDDFLIIPRAQLVGLLHTYSALVPAPWLDDLTEATVTGVETLHEDALAGGGDGLRYALDLAETDSLSSLFRERLLAWLSDLALRVVCTDPDEWGGYCATPLKLAPARESALARVLWDDLQTYLDYVIAQQTAEGTWEPTWTWGGLYPEVWTEAEREWRGYLTLETLTSLRSFGRLETPQP